MKLEECVGRRDINAAQLARITGYSAMYVQRILKGDQIPGLKFLKALEDISIEDIKRRGRTNNKLMEKVSFNNS